MKKLIAALLATGSLLAGCVAVEPIGYSSGTYYDNNTYSNSRGHRDRDRDGVPNRWDARPDNPRRY